MSREPFGARLVAAMAARGPLCVGVDPHPELLSAWDLPLTVAGMERFSMTVVEALADRVAVLKPQSAFFEAFGSGGVAVLEKVLAAGRQAGALMLLDAKRGDIGSTMGAYAAAYLTDGSPLAVDALTVSPYLGFGSLQPALDAALRSGRGLFVLALTSNPQGAQVQRATGPAGTTVAQQMADAAADINAGAEPLGSIGLVVGTTVGRTGIDLRRVNGPLLAPGLGAQGGTTGDLLTVFGDALPAVLPTSSREILRCGPSLRALQDAAAQTLDIIQAALGSRS